MTRTDLLHAIAEYLPEFCATQDEHDRWFLTRPDGAMIIVTGDAYGWDKARRVEISGSYAQHNGSHYGPRYEEAPHITCARSRGPESIAKDITRRFLPKYLPLYETSVRRYEDALTHDMLRDTALAQIGAILHCEPDDSSYRDPRIHYYSDQGNATIQASTDTVDMHLNSIPLSKAKAIAQILASKIGAQA